MLGRTVAVILVLIIVGYALFIRPKEEDAPKRMSTFQWLMKKRREKKAAEFAEAAAVRAGRRDRNSAEAGAEAGVVSGHNAKSRTGFAEKSGASTEDETCGDATANITTGFDGSRTPKEGLTIAQQKRAKGEKKVRE
jgi:hypothetical protein